MARLPRIKGQSAAARAARLDRGCCPIHGLPLGQITRYFETPEGVAFAFADCPRRDCDVICKGFSAWGPFEEVSPDNLPAEVVQRARHLKERPS